MVDIYFWRQIFVLVTGLFSSFTVGLMIAYPSVLNPAITAFNSTELRTSGDHASWIAAINGVGGLIGGLALSPIMQIMGRKLCHCSINTFLFIDWIIFSFANNIFALYAARLIQGISVGGVYLHCIIISEYVHATRRGYFVCLKKILIASGSLCCHALNTFWTWRQIAVFSTVPPFIAIVTTLFWPESPSYLALKGRFSECEDSFKWLNGNSEESQKYLKSLMEAQRGKIERNKNKTNSLVDLLQAFKNKGFRQALITSILLSLILDLSGKYYLVAYIIEIMNELLGNQSSAVYFTVGADILSLVALLMSTVLVRYAKRRTILFYAGISVILLMFLFSLLVYLKIVYTIQTPVLWITASLVILQCFIVNVGLSSVAFAKKIQDKSKIDKTRKCFVILNNR